MFTQSCFIRKSTKNIRIKLEKLGYRLFGPFLNEDLCIFTEPKYGLYSIEFFSNINHPDETEYIDCGTNEDLFLALAALRDDSDIYQLFKNNECDEFVKCDYDEFHLFTFNPLDALEHNDLSIYYHKATVEELIEHFKDNGKE